MKIQRKSKCIWVINGQRVDVRHHIPGDKFDTYHKVAPVHKALLLYFAGRNPGMSVHTINDRVSKLLNRHIPAFQALEWQEINTR